MPGPGGTSGRAIRGVGFWAQQPYYNIFSVDSGPFIFRPPLKGLPEQPFPPNAFQSWTYSYNLKLIGQDKFPTGEQFWELPQSQRPYELTRLFTWQLGSTVLQLTATSRNLNLVGVIHDELPPAYSIYKPIEQTWTATYNKNLVGKDRLPVGDQITDLSPRDHQRLSTYTWIQSTTALTLPAPPVTNAVFRGVWKSLPEQPFRPDFTWTETGNVYTQITVRPFVQSDWPNPQQPYRVEQTWTWRYNLNLIGQDRLPAGEQSYALAPSQVAPDQIQLRAWQWSYNLNLIGRDRMTVGDQVYDLAPSQKPPEQVQLHSWTYSYNLNLRGKDLLPSGEQISDLPPRDPREPRAWSWSYNQNLIAQDKLPVGAEIWERPTLPIAPALTWIQTVSYEEIAKPFYQTDWPNSTAPYRIEQTWTWQYNLNLIGQDRLPAGEQTTELPPRDFSRLFQIWIQQTNLALLTTPPTLLPRKGITDWPVPVAPPRLDQTWTASYNLNLIGQDQLPIRQQHWPLTPEAERAIQLRSWIDTVKFALVKPFNQQDWPNPTPPARDPTLTTWAASYNKNLIGQDALPFRQQDWPNPIPPAAVKDWIQQTNLALLSVVPRPFFQTDWPNPTQPSRLDQTWTWTYNKNLIGKDQLPIGAELTDLAPGQKPAEQRSEERR